MIVFKKVKISRWTGDVDKKKNKKLTIFYSFCREIDAIQWHIIDVTMSSVLSFSVRVPHSPSQQELISLI